MAAPNIEFILSLRDQTTSQMDEVIDKVQTLQTELQKVRSLEITPKGKGVDKLISDLNKAGLAVDNLQDLVSFLEKSLDIFTKQMQTTNKVNNELFKNTTNIEKFSKAVQKLQIEMESLGNIKGIDNLRTDLDKVKESLDAASKSGNFSSVTQGISSLRQDLDNLKSTARVVDDALKFDAAAAPAENSIASLRATLATLRSELEGADLGEESFRGLAQQVAAVEVELKQAQAAARELGSQANSFSSLSGSLEQLNAELQNTDSTTENFRELNELIGLFNRELEQTKQQAQVFQQVDGSIAQLNAELQLAQTNLQNTSFNTESFETAARQIGNVRREIQNIQGQQTILEQVQGSFNELTAKVADLQNQFNNASLGTDEFESLRNRLNLAQQELANFDVVPGSVQDISNQLQDVNNQLQQVSTNSNEFEVLTRRAAELTRELRDVQDVLSGSSLAGLSRSLADLNDEFNRADPADQAAYRQLAEDLEFMERRAQAAKDQAELLRAEFSQAFPLDSVQNIQRELQRLQNIQKTIDISTSAGVDDYRAIADEIDQVNDLLRDLKTRVDALGTSNSLSQLSSDVQNLNDQLQNTDRTASNFQNVAQRAGEAARQLQSLQNEIRVLGAVTGSVEQLQASLQGLNADLSNATVGSARFNELALEVGRVTAQVNLANDAISRLASDDLDDITVLQAKIEALQNTLRRGVNADGALLNPDEIRDINSAVDFYSDRIANAEANQENFEVAVKRLTAQLKEARLAFLSLNPGDAGYEEAITNVRRLERELRAVEEQQEKVSKGAKTLVQRFGDLSRNLLLALGANEVFSIVRQQLEELVQVGRDYTAQLSGVRAITGATADEFDRLNQKARELGRTTTFTATEAAKSAEILAVAGFSVQEILDAQTGVLELAQAGGITLERAADIAASTLRGFGLQAGEINDVNEVLTNSFTNFNLVLEDFFEANKLFAPVAKSVGLELEESAALINALANAGFRGSIAGTALRALVVNLSKPSDKAARAIENLGITIKDAEGNMDNLIDLLGKFEERSLSSEVAARIFGKQVTAFNILVGVGAEVIRDYAAQVGEIGTSIRAIKDAFDDSAITVREFRLAIGDAETALDPLRGAIDGVKEAVDRADFTITEQAVLLGRFSQAAIEATRANQGLSASAQNLSEQEFIQERVQRDFASFTKFIASRTVRQSFEKIGASIDTNLGDLQELPEVLRTLEKVVPSQIEEIATAFVENELNLQVGVIGEDGQPFSVEQFNQTVAEITNAIATLVSDTSQIEEATVEIALFGTTADIAAQRIDNLEGDIKILNSAKQDLFLTIFSFLNPSLRDLVQRAQDITTEFNNNIAKYQDLTKAIFATISGFETFGSIMSGLVDIAVELGKSAGLVLAFLVPLRAARGVLLGVGKAVGVFITQLSVARRAMASTAVGASRLSIALGSIGKIGFGPLVLGLTAVVEVGRILFKLFEDTDEAAKKLQETFDSFEVSRAVRTARFNLLEDELTALVSGGSIDRAIEKFDQFKQQFSTSLDTELAQRAVDRINEIFESVEGDGVVNIEGLETELNTLFKIIEAREEKNLKDEIALDLKLEENSLQEKENELIRIKDQLLDKVTGTLLTQEEQQRVLNELAETRNELDENQDRLNERAENRELTKNLDGQIERLDRINKILTEQGKITIQNDGREGGFRVVDLDTETGGNARRRAVSEIISELNLVEESLRNVQAEQVALGVRTQENLDQFKDIVTEGGKSVSALSELSSIILRDEQIQLETERFRKSFEVFVTDLGKVSGITKEEIAEISEEILELTRLSGRNFLSALDTNDKELLKQQTEFIKTNLQTLINETGGFEKEQKEIFDRQNSERLAINAEIQKQLSEDGITNFSQLVTRVKGNADILTDTYKESFRATLADGRDFQTEYNNLLERTFNTTDQARIQNIIDAEELFRGRVDNLNVATQTSLNDLQKKLDDFFIKEGGIFKEALLGKGGIILNSREALEGLNEVTEKTIQGLGNVTEEQKKRAEEFAERLKQLILQANEELEVRAAQRRRIIDDIEAANLRELATRREFTALSIQQQAALLQQVQDEYSKKRRELLAAELTETDSLAKRRIAAREKAVEREINAISAQNALKLVQLRQALDNELISIQEYEEARLALVNESNLAIAEAQRAGFDSNILIDSLEDEVDERTRIQNLVLGKLETQKNEEIARLEERRDAALKILGAEEDDDAKSKAQRESILQTFNEGYLRSIERFNNQRVVLEKEYQSDINDLEFFEFDADKGLQRQLKAINDVFSAELEDYTALVTASAKIQASLESDLENERQKRTTQVNTNRLGDLEAQLQAQQDVQKQYSDATLRLLDETERAKFLLRSGVDEELINQYLTQVKAAEANLQTQREIQSALLNNISSTADKAAVILQSERDFRAFEQEELARLEEEKLKIFESSSLNLTEVYDGQLVNLNLFINEERRLLDVRNKGYQEQFEKEQITFEQLQAALVESQDKYVRAVATLTRTTLNNLLSSIDTGVANEVFRETLTSFRGAVDDAVEEYSEGVTLGDALSIFTDEDIQLLLGQIDKADTTIQTGILGIFNELKKLSEEQPIEFDPLVVDIFAPDVEQTIARRFLNFNNIIGSLNQQIVDGFKARGEEIKGINEANAQQLLDANTDALGDQGQELFREILQNTQSLSNEYNLLFNQVSGETSDAVQELIQNLTAGEIDIKGVITSIQNLAQQRTDGGIFDNITTEEEVQLTRARIDNLVNIITAGTTDVERIREIQLLGEQEYLSQVTSILNRRFDSNEENFKAEEARLKQEFDTKKANIEAEIQDEQLRADAISKLRVDTNDKLIVNEQKLFDEQQKIVRARQAVVGSEVQLRVNAIENQITQLRAAEAQLDSGQTVSGVVAGVDFDAVENDYEFLQDLIAQKEQEIIDVKFKAYREAAQIQSTFNRDFATSTGAALQAILNDSESIIEKINELEIEIATSGDEGGQLTQQRDQALKELQQRLSTSNKTFLDSQNGITEELFQQQTDTINREYTRSQQRFEERLSESTRTFERLGAQADKVRRGILLQQEELELSFQSRLLKAEEEKVEAQIQNVQPLIKFYTEQLERSDLSPRVREYYSQILTGLLQDEQEYTDAKEDLTNKRIELNNEETANAEMQAALQREILRQARDAAIDFAVELFNTITDAEIEASRRRIEQYELEFEARIALLENESERKLAEIDELKSEAELDAELARLQTIEGKREEFRKREERRLEQQIKEAEKLRDQQVKAEEERIQRITKLQQSANQAVALSNAIATTVALVRGVAESGKVGFPAALVTIPAFLASIAAAIAFVKTIATPASFFEQGGYVDPENRVYAGQKAARGGVPYGGKLVGRRHSQGGIPIEAEGGEFIINREGYRLFPKLVEFINQQGRNKMKGSVYNSSIPEELLLAKTQKAFSSYVPKQPTVPKRLVGKAQTGGQVVTPELNAQSEKFDTMISLLQQVATNQQNIDVRFSQSEYENFLAEQNSIQTRIDV